MKREYVVRESRINLPFVGKLVARALGQAYVENGGFYDSTAGNPKEIIVGKGRREINAKGVLALTGEQGEFTGEEDLVNAINMERYVMSVEAKTRRVA